MDRPTTLGFENLVDALREFIIADSGFDPEAIIQLWRGPCAASVELMESMTLPVEGFEENSTSYVGRATNRRLDVIDAFGAGGTTTVDTRKRIPSAEWQQDRRVTWRSRRPNSPGAQVSTSWAPWTR